MRPKVSIITCSYNRPERLKRAIQSLRDQTDQDWEHLIYDDFSTKKYATEVLEVLEWALEDPRTRVWMGQENLNRPSVLWNFMLDRAHGRYLTVLDDDNEKLPTFVEAMSKELDEDPELDVVTCGWRVDRLDDGPEGNYYLNRSTSEERLRELSTCDGGAMLYRREIFDRAGYFSEELRTNEDWHWLRRAHHIGKVKNLLEVHSTYLSHGGSRMHYCEELGNKSDVAKIRRFQPKATLSVQRIYPSFGRLTQSQKDVCESVERGINNISWVTNEKHPDLALVVSPFQQDVEEIVRQVHPASCALSLHMEDPYALSANLARVQRLAQVIETWVCTNDVTTVSYYQKIVGDRVLTCPLLGADDTVSVQLPPVRDIDVLLCGYAYPSRKRFMLKLLPLLQGLSVYLVGDEWEQFKRDGVTVMPTQQLPETYALHARARTVVCLHRVHGDCSDGPVAPQTLNRGYMEGFSGARVFIDKSRPLHGLDEDDVVFYDGPGDLAVALRECLAQEEQNAAKLFADKCRRAYTYRARLERILNSVRAPRFLVEIP